MSRRWTPPIAANQPLPWGAGGTTFTWLLATLSPLPEDLDYRLIGRTLALIDLRAGNRGRRAPRSGASLLRPARHSGSSSFERQANADRGSARRGAVDGNLPVVRLDDPLRGGKAEARAARFGREEGSEDLLADLRRNTWTSVDERNLAARIDGVDRYSNSSFPLHGMRAVDQEIVEHDLQHLGIGGHGWRGSLDVHLDIPKRWVAAQEIRCDGDERHDVDWRPARLRRPRKEQEVLHHLVERIDAVDDLLHDRRARGVLRHAAAEDLDRAADAGQRVLHLVCDNGSHLPQSRQGSLLAHFLFHADTGAEIVKDAGELSRAANRELADGEMQGKRRAVLAHPRDLATDSDNLGPACCEIPREIGVVLLAVRRRHQHVDVVAEDVGLCVPEQPLGGRIEPLDAAVFVDHDDAVDRGVDDCPPSRLARLESLVEPRTLRQIAQQAGKLAFTADTHLA